MTMGLFRQEAVQAHEGTKERGDILRFERRWETVAVKVVAIAAVVGFLFASLFGVDEYAKGAAVVRIDQISQVGTGETEFRPDQVLVGIAQAADALLFRLGRVESDAVGSHGNAQLPELASAADVGDLVAVRRPARRARSASGMPSFS